MKTVRGLPPKKVSSVFLTLGFFDGVHLGHRTLLQNLTKRAKEKRGVACVVTFFPHPSHILSANPVSLLTSWEEKRWLISRLGIDLLLLFSFTRKFSLLLPEEFLEKLLTRLEVREIIIGEDFSFGKHRRGTSLWLKTNGPRLGIRVSTFPLLKVEGEKISSSLIRKLIKEGNFEKASNLLGGPFPIWGKVIKGKGRGKKLSFPTANLKIPSFKLLPPPGVYGGRCLFNSTFYPVLLNVGTRPTFGEEERVVEVHVLNFRGELYGRVLRVEVIEKIREIEKFPSLSALKKKIEEDKRYFEEKWRKKRISLGKFVTIKK